MTPDDARLAQAWHRRLGTARATIDRLPPQEAGTRVLGHDGTLLRADPEGLTEAQAAGHVHFHRGSIRGAMPRLIDTDQPSQGPGAVRRS